jgi:DNA repair protein RadC
LAALGDNELLALVIGHGPSGVGALAVANETLAAAGGVQRLPQQRLNDLRRINGLGEVLAARVMAAIELGRRTLTHPPEDRLQFANGRDIALYLIPQFGAFPVERTGVVLLDGRHRLLRVQLLATGVLDACSLPPREVMREAIAGGASGVAVFHNHPSGDPTPSGEDLALTRRLFIAGEIVGIQLVDHLILADTHYISMWDSGRLAAITQPASPRRNRVVIK